MSEAWNQLEMRCRTTRRKRKTNPARGAIALTDDIYLYLYIRRSKIRKHLQYGYWRWTLPSISNHNQKRSNGI